jgi:hypothetical protein
MRSAPREALIQQGASQSKKQEFVFIQNALAIYETICNHAGTSPHLSGKSAGSSPGQRLTSSKEAKVMSPELLPGLAV